MIAMRYESQDANLCGSVNRKSIWYNFLTVMKLIQYSVNRKSEVSYKSWKIESTFRLTFIS